MLKQHKPNEVEAIIVTVTETVYPKLFAAMVAEVTSTGVPLEEAKKEVEGRKVEMELYYSPGLALFGLESEALELGANVLDPFTGKKLIEAEE